MFFPLRKRKICFTGHIVYMCVWCGAQMPRESLINMTTICAQRSRNGEWTIIVKTEIIVFGSHTIRISIENKTYRFSYTAGIVFERKYLFAISKVKTINSFFSLTLVRGPVFDGTIYTSMYSFYRYCNDKTWACMVGGGGVWRKYPQNRTIKIRRTGTTVRNNLSAHEHTRLVVQFLTCDVRLVLFHGTIRLYVYRNNTFQCVFTGLCSSAFTVRQ